MRAVVLLLACLVFATVLVSGERPPSRPTPEELAQALRILDDATQAALLIDDPMTRAVALAHIATAQGKAGDWQAAGMNYERSLDVIGLIEPEENHSDERDTYRAAVGQLRLQAGDLEGATKILDTLKDDWARSYLLSDIAVAHATAGRFDTALEMLQQLQDADSRDHYLEWVAHIALREGNIDQALHLVETMQTPELRVEALTRLAAQHSKADRPEEAARAIQEAQAIAGQMDPDERAVSLRGKCSPEESVTAQDTAYESIAYGQIGVGDLSGALNTLSLIRNPGRQELVLISIAGAQARSGDLIAARATAERIQWQPCRATALGKIAEAQLKAGSLPGALGTIDTIKDSEEKARLLIRIARGQLQTGAAAAAMKTVDRALEAAQQAERTHWRASLLTDIAELQAVAGQRSEAAQTFQLALSVAVRAHEEAKLGHSWTGSLSSFPQAQAKAGFFREALSTAEHLEGNDRLEALREIALEQAKAGDFQGALAWAEIRRPPAEKANALLGVAQGLLGPLNESRSW